jgi:hypothetical protein
MLRDLKQSTNFEECALCRNGDFPANAKLKLSENSQVTCEDIYLELSLLNKSINKGQCLKKTTQYRNICCVSTASSFLHSLSTLAGLLFFCGFARRLFSSRRIRTASGDDESVDEVSMDYTDMDDDTKITRDSRRTKNAESPSGAKSPNGNPNRGRKKFFRDDDTLFSFQSTIRSLISTPPKRKKKLRKVTSKSKTARKIPKNEAKPLPTQLV